MKHPASNNNINAIEDVRKLFNELSSNLSSKETKRIRKKLYEMEAASNFFKEKEQDGTLTNRQKNVLKNIARYIKNIKMHLKNFGKHLNKIHKNQYGLDYLFNQHTSNNDIKAFKDARELLNECRSNLSHEERNEIRKKLFKKEVFLTLFVKDIKKD